MTENKQSVLDHIQSIVGNDILEIFGATGTCKSKFVHAIALEALNSGKKVFYLDTERNLSNNDISLLKGVYTYNPVFEEIINIIKNLDAQPKKHDLVIIDSVGLPILTKYARLGMKQKGEALLSLIALMGDLKEYAFKNNAMVIVTNQPESDFNKTPGTIRYPFGDKSCFVVKEIWKTEKVNTNFQNTTVCNINAFRSRSISPDKQIVKIEVSDKGTIIKIT